MPDLAAALRVGDLDVAGNGRDRFAHRWDPREDFDGAPSDYGWIGEDETGVWMTRHPDLVDAPMLDGALTHFRAGVREWTSSDVERLSASTITGLLVLSAAAEREAMRRAHGKA